MTIHTAIPEDRQEPKPVVQFRCPQCGSTEDPGQCEGCGDPLCSNPACEPSPEMHVACMDPERKAPYLLLLDCRSAFLRILKAANKGIMSDCIGIAGHYNRMLEEKGIR